MLHLSMVNLWVNPSPGPGISWCSSSLSVAVHGMAAWVGVWARGEGRTGNKAWLRRALYAVIVRVHLAEDDDT